MKIRILEQSEHRRFFDLSSEHGSIFTWEKWVSMYGDHAVLVGLFREDETFIGGMVFYATRMKGFRSLITPPFAPHCGLFWIDQGITNAARWNSFVKEVSGNVASFLKNSGYAFVKVELPPAIGDVQPFLWSRLHVLPRYTYQMDLKKDEEMLRNHLDSRTRSVLNKAGREEFTVSTDASPETIEKFIETTLGRSGSHTPTYLVKEIVKRFGDAENALMLCIHMAGEPVGAAICLSDKTSAYYLLSGYDREARSNAIMTFGVWNSILWARKRELNCFDFEGSMIPDIEKFFRGFGADLVPYYTIMGGNRILVALFRWLK